MQHHRSSILLLITTILLIQPSLSSCSKKSEPAESASSSADLQSVALKPEPESGKTSELAKSQDVPQLLLSDQANPLEKTRPMVKTASVDFEVGDVYQSALQLEQLTTEFAGFVEQKDIRKQVEDQFTRSNSDGTQIIFSKIKPHASMVVRIPQNQTLAFINSLPKFMLFLNEQRYEAKRFELRLLQDKLAQPAGAVTTANAKLDSTLSREIAVLTRQEVQDRLNYSTIQLEFSQAATLRQTKDIQLAVVARQHDSFFTRLWHSIESGATGFLDFIIVATLLWPLWLLLIAGLLIWRYKKHRRLLLKQSSIKNTWPNEDT